MKLYTKNKAHTTYHYITTKQFKTRVLTMRFLTDLNTTNITARSIMLAMLGAKNSAYPTRKAQSKYLETLYDSIFHTRSVKLGTKHVNQLTMVMIDDDYALEEGLFNHVLTFLNKALFHPLFDEKTLEEEKQFLKDYFKAEYTNKTRYAQKRYYECLLEDYPFNAHALGNEAHIDAITLEDIEHAYNEMMTQNHVYISLTGDIDVNKSHEVLTRELTIASKEHQKPILYRHDFTEKPMVKEVHDVTQNRVFMTLKSDIYFRDEAYFTMLVLNTLLGEGSDSLLFKTVRETHSLAYYIHSSYSPFTGLITITSAMSQTSIEAGKKLILSCLEAIKEGAFEESDLALAKAHLISSFKQSYDTASALSLRALRTTLFKVPFKEDSLMDIIRAVSKRDLTVLAKKLEHIFTYELGGRHGNENV